MKKAKATTKAKAKKRKVSPIPKGYHWVTPYLSVRGGAAAIEFYKKAFGAKEIMRMPGPSGNISHAEIEIGGSRFPAGRAGRSMCGTSNAAQVQEVLQKLLAERVGPFILQRLRPMLDMKWRDFIALVGSR